MWSRLIIPKSTQRVITKLPKEFSLVPEPLHKAFVLGTRLESMLMDYSGSVIAGSKLKLTDPSYKFDSQMLEVFGKKSPIIKTFSIPHDIGLGLYLYALRGRYAIGRYENVWGAAFSMDGVNVMVFRGTKDKVLELLSSFPRELFTFNIEGDDLDLAGSVDKFLNEELCKPIEGGILGYAMQIRKHLETLDRKAELVIYGYSAGTVTAQLTGYLAKKMGFTNVKCVNYAPVPFCSKEAAAKIEALVPTYYYFNQWDAIPFFYGPRSFAHGVSRQLAFMIRQHNAMLKPLIESGQITADPWSKAAVDFLATWQAEAHTDLQWKSIETERVQSNLRITGKRFTTAFEYPEVPPLYAHDILNIKRDVEDATSLYFVPDDDSKEQKAIKN